MAAYKKLKKEDSYLTTYVAHKSFTVSGSQHDEVGVETYIGISGSGDWFPSGSDQRLIGTDFEHSTRLVYNSVNHLYYSGYNAAGLPTTSSNSLSGSAYENYLQSSYTANQRRAQGEFTVISIPQNLYPSKITSVSELLINFELFFKSSFFKLLKLYISPLKTILYLSVWSDIGWCPLELRSLRASLEEDNIKFLSLDSHEP